MTAADAEADSDEPIDGVAVWELGGVTERDMDTEADVERVIEMLGVTAAVVAEEGAMTANKATNKMTNLYIL